jgi:hypothetical protein
MRKPDRPIAAAVAATLLPTTIPGWVLNLDVSLFHFAHHSSEKFGVRGPISPVSLKPFLSA